MHPRSRLSVNDSNNNSVEASKDSRVTANNDTLRHVPSQSLRELPLEKDARNSSSDSIEDQSKEGQTSSERAQHGALMTNSAEERHSTPLSPSCSSRSSSPSPSFQADTDIIVDNDPIEARQSTRMSTAAGICQDPPLGPKPGLSFSIDRILSNSCSDNTCGRSSEERTHRVSRANRTSPMSSPEGSVERRTRLNSSRHGSVSEDSSRSVTPRSSAASPVGGEPVEDLINSRLREAASRGIKEDHPRHRLPGVPAHSPGCLRPPVDSIRGFSTAGPGHPTRAGHPELGVSDLAGYAGHATTGAHNPYHSPGLFLPPPSDICRIEQHSPSSLSSLDLLPVRPILPDVFVCPWTGVQRDRFGLVRRIGHPYQNRTPPKRKKPRTAFTRQQVLELEKRFSRQKYLASAERSSLAKSLGMSDAQVKTWFQNRRTKWRRQTAEEREIERQAAHKFLLSLRPDDPPRPIAFSATPGVSICPPVASQPGRLPQPQQEVAAVGSA